MSETSDTPAPPPSDRELLTLFLKGRAIKCPVCDYELTDLPDGVCPECGLALELRLGLTRPRQRAYIAGLIGLGAGLGFHVFIFVYLIWMLWFSPGWSVGSTRYFIPLTVGIVVTIPSIVVWARSWGYFQRCSRGIGLLLVAACWVFSLASAIWFFWIP